MKAIILPRLAGGSLACGLLAIAAPAQQPQAPAAAVPSAPPRPAAAPPAAAAPAPAASTSAAAPIDDTILHAQVILDHLGFSPGVIDGKTGKSLALALSGFQAANGLPVNGKLDQPTAAALNKYKATAAIAEVTITPQQAAGPFVGPLPRSYAKQAKMPALGYADLAEELAEQYHTTKATLVALNGPAGRIGAGATIKVPNVLTQPRAYPEGLRPDWTAMLASLNIASDQPQADHLVVGKAAGALMVYDAANKLVAQFPVTTGSSHDPLPIGKWKINGPDYLPKFHYNPKLFWDAKKNEKAAMLPAGPNGPVGILWLDLSKEHYGIHGTPNPETIGRAQSHGCIRLTNWDVARLSLMVKPGTPAIFQP